MRINIVSGDVMAQYAENFGIKNCISFNEAMIDGTVTASEPFGQAFINERAKVHKMHSDKYKKRLATPLLKIRSGDEVHIYFGEDMFCQLNLITLLCFLEKSGISHVTYHVIFEDEMKETALIENLETAGFSEIYNAVLVQKRNITAPIEITNKALLVYFDYLDDNGKLASFIKSNPDDSALQLTVKIIKQFSEYGLGETQCREIIERLRSAKSENV